MLLGLEMLLNVCQSLRQRLKKCGTKLIEFWSKIVVIASFSICFLIALVYWIEYDTHNNKLNCFTFFSYSKIENQYVLFICTTCTKVD